MRHKPPGSLAGLLLTFIVLGSACESSHKTDEGVPAQNIQAAMCPNCETVWVHEVQAVGKSRIMTYTAKSHMECPDCRSAATNFFATGRLEHACATCGGTLERCTIQPSTDH